jgi:Zn-dependent protease with chaperone function
MFFQFDDNIVRFVLLHEACHIEKKGLLRIENILIGLVIVLMSCEILITHVFKGITAFIFSFFIGILILGIACFIIKLSINSMKDEELRADECALKKFKECYTVPDLCLFIDEIFKAMDTIVKDQKYKTIINENIGNDRITKLLFKYSGLDQGYHPTIELRAQRLKEIIKCKKNNK